MFTLQDFLTLTKGQEYLIALGAMILFAVFWVVLDKPRTKEDSRDTHQK